MQGSWDEAQDSPRHLCIWKRRKNPYSFLPSRSWDSAGQLTLNDKKQPVNIEVHMYNQLCFLQQLFTAYELHAIPYLMVVDIALK